MARYAECKSGGRSVRHLGRSRLIASLALALAIGACEESREKGEVKVTPHPPPEPLKRAPLTVDTIDEFIEYAGSAGRDELEYIRQQLDASRSQPAIVQGLLDALSRAWRYVDGRHVIAPMAAPDTVLALVAHVGPSSAIDVIHEMVWRPLPPPPTGDGEFSEIELLEANAAEALGCIEDQRARKLSDEIMRAHPSGAVRDAATQQRLSPHCLYPFLAQ